MSLGPLAAARAVAASRALVVAVAVAGLDQLLKHTVGTSVLPGHVTHVVPGLTLVHVRNTGVAFGFLGGGGTIVYGVTAAALVALCVFLLLRPRKRWLWVPVGMLVGGALGNLIDRVVRGSVIDFIKLPHWPAFNLADASITVGVVVLLVVVEYAGEDRDEPA